MKLSLDAIKPNPDNPRLIKDDAFKKLVKSIKEFPEMLDARELVLNKDHVILGGNMRFKAAKEAGLKEVPVKIVDWPEDKQREFVIKDNVSGGEWDWDLLANEWDAELLNDWGLDTPDDWNEEKEVEEDEAPEVSDEPAISKLGEVYELGRHRLMCGDSTDFGDVSELLNGTSVDMIFTDPPYNVAFNGRSGKHDVILNDKLTDTDFNIFIDKICEIIQTVDAKVYYVWCNWEFYGVLQSKLPFKACIVWAKNVFGLGVGYRHQHEFCLFNGKIDQEIKNESDLWNIAKDTNYAHPTQKPVALSVRAFGNHVKLLNVLDLFGGSGSTLIGAEQTGRTAFVMELDPKYVDVIRKRYHKFITGSEDGWEDGTPAIRETAETTV